MADPALLRAGLAANLSSLDMQVSPYVLSSPTPPCAYVQSGPVAYDMSFGRGHDEWTFIVFVLVGYVHDIGAQMQLDGMRRSHGPTSIKTLLESDRTLGGAAFSLGVPSVTPERIYDVEGQAAPAVLGAEWTVVVQADGGA